MNKKQIQEVVEIYRQYLKRRNIEKIEYSYLEPLVDKWLALPHCAAMLDEIDRFAQEGRIKKAVHWLGFVQASLWINGVFNLYELDLHIKPRNKKRKASRS